MLRRLTDLLTEVKFYCYLFPSTVNFGACVILIHTMSELNVFVLWVSDQVVCEWRQTTRRSWENNVKADLFNSIETLITAVIIHAA